MLIGADPDPSTVGVKRMEVTVENRNGSCLLTAMSSVIDGRFYLDYITVEITVERSDQTGGR